MIKIERASVVDLATVVALFERYRLFYRRDPAPAAAEQFIGARLRSGDSTIFLARDAAEQDRAVGMMQLYPLFSSTAMKRLWLLNDLYVEESHRRRGVGGLLIDRAKELCKETEARGLFLETEASNSGAQALYEAMGLERLDNYFYGFDV